MLSLTSLTLTSSGLIQGVLSVTKLEATVLSSEKNIPNLALSHHVFSHAFCMSKLSNFAVVQW
jgi:hypothetical protein